MSAERHVIVRVEPCAWIEHGFDLCRSDDTDCNGCFGDGTRAVLDDAVPVTTSGFGLVWEPGSSPLVKPWSRDYRPSRRIPVRVTADNEHDIEWLWVKQ